MVLLNFKEVELMIDMSKIKINKINNFSGFMYMGEPYFHIKNVAEYLRLKTKYGCNWSRFHELFYNALRMLRINPDDYPIPLNHIEPVYGKAKISKNEKDLPLWIKGNVFITMAQSKEDNYIYTNYIQTLQDSFKNLDNMINTENKFHREGTTYLDQKGENNMTNIHESSKYKIKRLNELGIKVTTCIDGELELKGFVKNGDIYLNSEDAAHMVGLIKETNYGFVVRWDMMYKYFSTYASMFNYNSVNQGFDFRDPSNKAGFSSRYEIMVPEYIPFKIVFMIANRLNNIRASKLRFDMIFTILPHFMKTASDDEISKVEFLNSMKPLIEDYKDQNNTNLQYYQAPPLTTYFPNIPINNNYRPAIPGWNGKPLSVETKAYTMPSPKEIQKHLDSQPKYLKEVVRFEDPNKNK